ncbi:hypothetical protein [Streptomyces sp. YIM S03343]
MKSEKRTVVTTAAGRPCPDRAVRLPGTSRPALRLALFGLSVTVVGYALFAAWLLVHLHQYENARARATATTNGVVVEDGIGDEEDIRVRWTDGGGHVHIQRFAVYDTDRYTKGRQFPVAYDPARTVPQTVSQAVPQTVLQGFPGDRSETAAEEDLSAPVGLVGVVAAALCGVWGWRGLRFGGLKRRSGKPMTATVWQGDRGAAPWRGPRTIWISLTDPEGTVTAGETSQTVGIAHPAGAPEEESGTAPRPRRASPATRWQRVMWHPALDDSGGRVPVTVRRATVWTRSALVELPDGTRLVPLGRLRGRPARHMGIDDHEAARIDLRDAFVLPPGTETLSSRPWWATGAVLAALGAALGIPAGVQMGGGSLTALVGFALFLAPLCPALWALSAPQP